MANALENFFNWQSDQDWFWGPLLFLRPPKNVRMTLRFWLKMLGLTFMLGAVIGFTLSALLAYYDYAAAKHHDPKIPPVIATEIWLNRSSPQAVLSGCVLLLIFCVAYCVCQHWAWNRRADRLNREKDHALKRTATRPSVTKCRFAGLGSTQFVGRRACPYPPTLLKTRSLRVDKTRSLRG